MDINDIYPSKYLKAADLKGHEPVVVIASAIVEKIGGDDTKKLVLRFQGKEKGLVCNRTNADRIAFLYGPNTDGWIGKEVVLYADMVSFQGRTVEALRVKAAPQRGNVHQPVRQEQATLTKVDRGNYDAMERHKATPPQDDAMDDGEVPF